MHRLAEMDSKKKKSPKKRIRKYHTKKAPIINSYIDMAEARREIVHALHLHRSSSENYALLGQTGNSQQHYYSIVESLPIPQPTWSTTGPAIHTSPPPSSSAGEVPEFDWWIGFLKSLDGKKSASSNGREVVILEENNLMENSKAVSQLQDGLKNECTDANEDPSYKFSDEWLIIPDHVLEL